MGAPSDEAPLPRVKFVYITPDNLERHYINGAYGGLSPRGEIVCDFFFEHKNTPSFEETVDGGESVTVIPGETPTSIEISREIKCSIILSPLQAESIAKWILNWVEIYKKGLEGH